MVRVKPGFRRALLLGGVIGALAGLAACSSPPPPPPRPTPPDGAAENLVVPPLGSDGVRQSVNRGVSPAQALWNLRSAWNVAALECPQPEYVAVQDSYRLFLKANALELKKAQRQVDTEFRAKYGRSFATPRDAYLTAVYNHFALPPVLRAFCDAMVGAGHDAATVTPKGIGDFAQVELPTIEVVFDRFYDRYDKYRTDAAAWDAKYGDAKHDAGAGSSIIGPTTGRATAGDVGHGT